MEKLGRAGNKFQPAPLIKPAGRLILESVPKEPMALAALAEADYTLGNLHAAISYLSHGVDAMPQNIAFYQRLIYWHRQAGNEQGAQAIIRLMQQRGVHKQAA